MLGGIVREIQLRICGAGEEVGSGRVIRIGEIRGGKERRILLDLGDFTHVYVEYSYIEGEIDECVRRTGETVVGVGEKPKKKQGADEKRNNGLPARGKQRRRRATMEAFGSLAGNGKEKMKKNHFRIW